MELELEGQELDVGDFRADILCLNTEDNSRVLIENQLERTDHNHLGQNLTYAAGLDIHTVIWIAQEFREEHRAALDRLNEITNENFRYFGIEIKVWKIEDSASALQFEIVSSPNDWSRTISRDTQQAASRDLSETQLQLKRFWTAMRDYMAQKDSPLKFPKPSPWRYLIFSIGRAGFNINPVVATRDKSISISLYLSDKDSTAHFHLLKEQQVEIETELEDSLEWAELPERKSSRISLRKTNTDPGDETDWPNQHEWFASKLELFDKVFRPRIKALNADDWEPPEDEDDK